MEEFQKIFPKTEIEMMKHKIKQKINQWLLSFVSSFQNYTSHINFFEIHIVSKKLKAESIFCIVCSEPTTII